MSDVLLQIYLDVITFSLTGRRFVHGVTFVHIGCFHKLVGCILTAAAWIVKRGYKFMANLTFRT